MLKHRAYIWLLPILTLAMGAVVLISGQRTRHSVMTETRGSFERQVRAAAQLVSETTGGAAASVELAYDLSELELEATARLRGHMLTQDHDVDTQGLLQPVAELDQGELTVLIWHSSQGQERGFWGALTTEDQQRLRRAMDEVLPGMLVDDGEVGALGLMCMGLDIAGGSLIACRSRTRLQRLRRRVGLAPLLKAVARSELRYAVLQDGEGLIAASPGSPKFKPWQADPELGQALRDRPDPPRLRALRLAGDDLLEGLSVITLPDKSTALLRVGMDARPLLELEQQVDRQQLFLTILVAALLLISLLAALWLQRAALRAERNRQEMDRQAEEARHWQAIGQMAATVAHEVRNPLNTVLMVGQRLAREFVIKEEETKEYQELLVVLKDQAQRVEKVIHDFLDLGRPLQLQLETKGIQSLVEVQLSALSLRAAHEDKLLQIAGDADLQLGVDVQRFGQILTNLVDNALAVTPPGGTVAVAWQSSSSSQGRAELQIRISDQGPGLSDAELQRVFEPFYTTKARGIGLGLPLVKRLCEAMGGRFELRSTPGQGSEALLWWPLAKDVNPNN